MSHFLTPRQQAICQHNKLVFECAQSVHVNHKTSPQSFPSKFFVALKRHKENSSSDGYSNSTSDKEDKRMIENECNQNPPTTSVLVSKGREEPIAITMVQSIMQYRTFRRTVVIATAPMETTKQTVTIMHL